MGVAPVGRSIREAATQFGPSIRGAGRSHGIGGNAFGPSLVGGFYVCLVRVIQRSEGVGRGLGRSRGSAVGVVGVGEG